MDDADADIKAIRTQIDLSSDGQDGTIIVDCKTMTTKFASADSDLFSSQSSSEKIENDLIENSAELLDLDGITDDKMENFDDIDLELEKALLGESEGSVTNGVVDENRLVQLQTVPQDNVVEEENLSPNNDKENISDADLVLEILNNKQGILEGMECLDNFANDEVSSRNGQDVQCVNVRPKDSNVSEEILYNGDHESMAELKRSEEDDRPWQKWPSEMKLDSLMHTESEEKNRAGEENGLEMPTDCDDTESPLDTLSVNPVEEGTEAHGTSLPELEAEIMLAETPSSETNFTQASDTIADEPKMETLMQECVEVNEFSEIPEDTLQVQDKIASCEPSEKVIFPMNDSQHEFETNDAVVSENNLPKIDTVILACVEANDFNKVIAAQLPESIASHEHSRTMIIPISGEENLPVNGMNEFEADVVPNESTGLPSTAEAVAPENNLPISETVTMTDKTVNCNTVDPEISKYCASLLNINGMEHIKKPTEILQVMDVDSNIDENVTLSKAIVNESETSPMSPLSMIWGGPSVFDRNTDKIAVSEIPLVGQMLPECTPGIENFCEEHICGEGVVTDVLKEIMDLVFTDIFASYEKDTPRGESEEILNHRDASEAFDEDVELSKISTADVVKEVVESILTVVFSKFEVDTMEVESEDGAQIEVSSADLQEVPVKDGSLLEDCTVIVSCIIDEILENVVPSHSEKKLEEDLDLTESVIVSCIIDEILENVVPSHSETNLQEDEDLTETVSEIKKTFAVLTSTVTPSKVDFNYSDLGDASLLARFVSCSILEDIIDEVVYGKNVQQAEDSDDDYDDRNDTCLDTYGSGDDDKSELGEDFTEELFKDLLTDVIRNNDKEVIVSDILSNIIDRVVEPSAIVSDILNEMLVKIVPSEMGMPIVVIEATTISPEYFKKLKRSPTTPSPSPKMSLRKRRMSTVAVELDMNMEIKEEVVDMPEYQDAEDDEVDIKPDLPPPEELMGRTRSGQIISPPAKKSRGRPRKRKGKVGRPKKEESASRPPPARRGVPVPPPVVKTSKITPVREPKRGWKAQFKEVKEKKTKPLPGPKELPERTRKLSAKAAAKETITKAKPAKRAASPPAPPVTKRRRPSPSPPPPPPPPPPKRRPPSPSPPPAKGKRKSAPPPPPPAKVSTKKTPTTTPTNRSTRASPMLVTPPAPVPPVPTATKRTRRSSPALVEASPPPPPTRGRKTAPAAKNFAVKSTVQLNPSPTFGRKSRKQDLSKVQPSSQDSGWVDMTWKLASSSGFGLKRALDTVTDIMVAKKRKTGISVRSCSIVLERSPAIDRLLPKKGKNEGIFCELCEPKRWFLTKNGLVDHLKTEHAGTFGSPGGGDPAANVVGDRCPGCNKKYHSHNRLVMHIKTCPAVVNPVPMANSAQIGVSPAQRGIQGTSGTAANRSSDDKRAYSCETCGERFTFWSALESHKRCHWGDRVSDPLDLEPDSSVEGKYESEMVRRGGGLKMTIRKEKPEYFRCDTCGAPFDKRDTLEQHKLIHRVKVKKERMSPELEILEEYIVPPPIGAAPPPPPAAPPSHCVPVSLYEERYGEQRPDPEEAIWQSYKTPVVRKPGPASRQPKRVADPLDGNWSREPSQPPTKARKQYQHDDSWAQSVPKKVLFTSKAPATKRKVTTEDGWEEARIAVGAYKTPAWHSPQGSTSKADSEEESWAAPLKKVVTATAKKSTGGSAAVRRGGAAADMPAATKSTARKSTGGQPVSRFFTAARRKPFLAFHDETP